MLADMYVISGPTMVDCLTSLQEEFLAKRLDHDLWVASGTISKARQAFAEHQAALGDSQLKVHCLTREHKSLCEEFEATNRRLADAWAECDILNKALEDESAKHKQLADLLSQLKNELENEVFRRELAEEQLALHGNRDVESQQVIKSLKADVEYHISVCSDLRRGAEQDRAAMENLKRKLDDTETHTNTDISCGSNDFLNQEEIEGTGQSHEPSSTPRNNKKRKTSRQ